LEDRPLFEGPEYRVFSYEDLMRRGHYEPLGREFWGPPIIDERLAEMIAEKLLPGIVEALRSILLGGYVVTQDILSSIRSAVGRRVQAVDVFESQALNAAGIRGVLVYRCLRSAGIQGEEAARAVKEVLGGSIQGSELSGLKLFAKKLFDAVTEASSNALIRWISKSISGSIDLEHASRVLGAEVKRARRALQIVTRVSGLGVQITSSKIDVSSRIREYERVVEAVSELSRRLGVELSPPIPMVATVVLKLPSNVDLDIASRLGGMVLQGNRAKLVGGFWTALVFKRTVNVYVDLSGNLDRVDSALLDCIPRICAFIEVLRQ